MQFDSGPFVQNEKKVNHREQLLRIVVEKCCAEKLHNSLWATVAAIFFICYLPYHMERLFVQ
jgi:hypothetical protein